MAPGLELNLDVTPEREGLGFYVLAALPLAGRTPEEASASPPRKVAVELELLAGVYYTINHRHRVFTTYEVLVRPLPQANEAPLDVGTVAVGYNVALLPDRLIFLSELRWDLPQADEPWAFGLVLGVKGALPSSGEPPREVPSPKSPRPPEA